MNITEINSFFCCETSELHSSDTHILDPDQREIGYYHFDKRLPAEGYLICFGFSENGLKEEYGSRHGDFIIVNIRSQIDIKKLDNRWRYVGHSEVDKYILPERNVENIPFDEKIVYYYSQKPEEGQKCLFVPAKRKPIQFGHEPLNEIEGEYKNGFFWIGNTPMTQEAYWRNCFP